MNLNELENRRWKLFLHIIDKQDLDLKGEAIKDYVTNFKSAYHRADNIVKWYNSYDAKINNMIIDKDIE